MNLKVAGLIAMVLLVAFISVEPIFFGKILDSSDENFRLLTTVYHKITYPGQEVIINSNIIKFGYTDRIDVSVETEIKDPEGNVIDSSMESFALETQASVIKRMFVEKNAALGLYTVNTRLIYKDKVEAAAKDTFRVEERRGLNSHTVILVSIIATLVLIVAALTLFILKRK